MTEKLLHFLRKLGLVRLENIYYIGGADVLPPPLKGVQEQQALEAMEAGDESAKSKLIEHNLRLVVYIARRFESSGTNLEDLISIGTIGLIKAIDNFDTSHDVRFSTYAVPMIIGEIRRYLRDYNAIRVSRSLKDTAYHAIQIKERIQNELGRDATVEEIAKEMGLEPVNIILAMEAIVEPISLYEPVYSDGGDTIFVMDQVGSSESDEDWLYEIAIKEAINDLSNREKQILNLRFMQGKTQMEVAEVVGISQAQVSRLEKGVIDKIKGN